MTKEVLITGCARSGTSMTAGILHMHGLFCGSTCGANRYNRKGMFENTAIRNGIVKPYLSLMGCDPMGQNPLPDTANLHPFKSLRKEMLDVLSKQGWDGQDWMYKGAKMCLFWPVLHEAFPKAKWVIVRRADDEIVNSCMKTAFMRKRTTPEEWQEWIDHHKRCFNEMHECGLDIFELWPSKFVYGDLSELHELIDWLGLEWNQQAVDDFIEPKFWSGK
jgi:hypothetical protein